MIHQSKYSLRQKAIPTPFTSGVPCVLVAQVSFASNAYTAASDVIELAALPANCRLLSARAIGDGVGAVTVDVGFMSGDFGDADDTRTVADELIDGVSVNDATATAALTDLLAIDPSAGADRSIGAVLSGDVAAGAKTLTLVLEYYYD